MENVKGNVELALMNGDYMICKMLCLDTASLISGWAYYENGKLTDYGAIDNSAHKKEWEEEERLRRMCHSLCDLIEQKKPDIICIEMTVVDRGCATQRLLSEIVGSVRGFCYSLKNVEFWEYRPSSWRRLCRKKGEELPKDKDGKTIKKRDDFKKWSVEKVKRDFDIDVTDDISDAILIGQAHINIFDCEER